jgi:hypothetical protein
MKDRVSQLLDSRKRLALKMPDPSVVLTGSLLSRMIQCNKPGCRTCQKGKGPGHGPIWILSVSLPGRRVRQIPIPKDLKPEVEAGLQRFADIQKLLKQIASNNQDLLLERKRS